MVQRIKQDEAALSGIVLALVNSAQTAGLCIKEETAHRLIASLLAKRFLVLTGLSGSGKTKVAQALADWITPDSVSIDPFTVGSEIQATNVVYNVAASDRLGVELWNKQDPVTATRNFLPREMIREWADYIEEHNVSADAPSIEIRDGVQKGSRFSNQLHSFHSLLKAAAFALLTSRQNRVPVCAFELIPVGADWTGNENILGYPDGLDRDRYVSKPALECILNAIEHPDVPHFLILDEMNLSHVERYFADFLSAIESDEPIPLHDSEKPMANGRRVPARLSLPDNLFIIGTVNVDETTYMFSPKVLDRANVMEFRMEISELNRLLNSPQRPDIKSLRGKGVAFANAFISAAQRQVEVPSAVKGLFEEEMSYLFEILQKHHAEYGYRTAYEASRFVHFYKELGRYADEDISWFRDAMDCVIVQKMLPKLHGARARLAPLLRDLWHAALHAPGSRDDERTDPKEDKVATAHYPISADKILRMWRLMSENGFASFAEA